MATRARKQRPPWLWVPSLYFSEGVPNAIVTGLSVVMYKKLGLPNASIAFYTSWLSLPWVLKPLWSPWVDITRTKRSWVVTMQFLVTAVLALLAFSLWLPNFFAISLALFLLVACFSATHDIAADGFYMLGLSYHEQVWWVGLRNTFYRVAVTSGNGLLILFAGFLEKQTGSIPKAWSIALLTAGGVFFLFSVWHLFVLPRPAEDVPVRTERRVGADFLATFGSFFRKPGVGMALAFILLYRLDEAQLTKVIPFFLLDPRDKGGLGLETGQEGLAYGTFGVIGLIAGGLMGGFLTAQFGWKRMLPYMVGAMYLPKYIFIWLAQAQPQNFSLICGAITAEQFGYGLGFTAFMLYLLYFVEGSHKTAHYTICTGFMTLGLMLPGMVSGKLAAWLGYQHFFTWVFFSAIPGLLLILKLKVNPFFGKKTAALAKNDLIPAPDEL
jgi:MFS transporter, PAT family, beta-lactamase induction signal transducer AmpG